METRSRETCGTAAARAQCYWYRLEFVSQEKQVNTWEEENCHTLTSATTTLTMTITKTIDWFSYQSPTIVQVNYCTKIPIKTRDIKLKQANEATACCFHCWTNANFHCLKIHQTIVHCNPINSPNLWPYESREKRAKTSERSRCTPPVSPPLPTPLPPPPPRRRRRWQRSDCYFPINCNSRSRLTWLDFH